MTVVWIMDFQISVRLNLKESNVLYWSIISIKSIHQMYIYKYCCWAIKSTWPIFPLIVKFVITIGLYCWYNTDNFVFTWTFFYVIDTMTTSVLYHAIPCKNTIYVCLLNDQNSLINDYILSLENISWLLDCLVLYHTNVAFFFVGL